MAHDDLFSVGAPQASSSGIRYTIKVVGGRGVGARPVVRPNTAGGCMTLQTPGGMVVLQPNVPMSFPTQGPWMMAHDSCSAPTAFPYSERPMCGCGGCAKCGEAPANDGNVGYLGEHDLPWRPMASGYDQPTKPGCGGSRPLVRPHVVGGCGQAPILANASLPVPQQLVLMNRWQSNLAPAAPSCSPCARATGPATLVYNPYGMF